MTIHERMVARSEREKDLLKYGRSQERERIINLLEDLDCEKNGNPNHDTHDCLYYQTADSLIALIKGEGENPKDNESVSLLPEEEN